MSTFSELIEVTVKNKYEFSPGSTSVDVLVDYKDYYVNVNCEADVRELSDGYELPTVYYFGMIIKNEDNEKISLQRSEIQSIENDIETHLEGLVSQF